MKQIQKNEVYSIISAISAFPVVSFDIFDTLIVRNVDFPKRVFEIVEREYLNLYGNSVKEFSKFRIEAEQCARRKTSDEITIDDIYSVLKDKYDFETIERLKNIEKKVELDICQANRKLKKVYDYCVENKKRIIIISDMYLPKQQIVKMLHKCGYSEYSELYLSCDYKKTKSEGSLYDIVLREQGILPSQLIHIGDNKKSDIKRAQEHGINTFHIEMAEKRLSKKEPNEKNNLDSVIQESLIRNNIHDNFDIYQKVGFQDFGPLLFGFLKWIKEQADINDCKKILFLSRDGYLMKRAFEILYPELTDRTCYFYASRRALQVANICNQHGFDEVVSTMFFPRVFKISWLIKRLGLNPGECKKEISLSGIKENEDIDGKTVITNEKLKNLFNLLEEQIITNSQKENFAFKKYLVSLGIEGNIAFVDIGWHGNMQNAFETMIKDTDFHINVYGMYVGLNPESKYQHMYNMQGYLYQHEKNEGLYYRSKYICSLLELLFMAPHGSTIKYTWEENNLKIDKDDFEYAGTDTANRMFRLQDASLLYIQSSKGLIDYINSAELKAFAGICNRFMNPDMLVADSFGDLEMWDDKWIKIAQKDSIKSLKRIKHNFTHASWKMGYLKRLFKIPFPYCDLVFILGKIARKI